MSDLRFRVFKRRKDWCHGCGKVKENLVEVVIESPKIDASSYTRLCRDCVCIVEAVSSGGEDYEC